MFTVPSHNETTNVPANVTYAGGYISYIKSKTEISLSLSEVEAVAAAISTGRMAPSLATNCEHVQNVERRLDPDVPRSCPKCAEQMVLRTTKSGDIAGSKFWGCSAFPKCRMVQKVTGYGAQPPFGRWTLRDKATRRARIVI